MPPTTHHNHHHHYHHHKNDNPTTPPKPLQTVDKHVLSEHDDYAPNTRRRNTIKQFYRSMH
jgi:hypothetical protein